jgi:signal transduction histidine kinase
MRVPTRRGLVLDSVLGAILAVVSWRAASFAWTRPDFGRSDFDHRGPPTWMFHSVTVSPWVLPAVILLGLGIAARRVWPRVAFVAVVVAVGVYLGAGANFDLIFLGPALCVFTLASMPTTMPRRHWIPLLALLAPMIVAAHWREPYLGLVDPAFYAGILTMIAVVTVPTLFALLYRSRRDNERREHDLLRRRSAYEERLRIAREVHDVVGHSLSVITMQAGVALHVLEKEQGSGPARPDSVTESLEAIKKTSREAMAELRTTLGVFRDDPDLPRAPVPGLGRLDALVDALRNAGREITVVREVSPDDRPVPAAVDQAAFRIIQESLTNVTRHAESARATVTVAQSSDRLTVEVADDGPAHQLPDEGNGIRGMRERAQAVGGSVTVSTRAPRGLLVRADLPTGGVG